MENTIQPERTLDANSLLAVSLILMDVCRTIRSVYTVVFLLLRYVRIGLSITNSLVNIAAFTA